VAAEPVSSYNNIAGMYHRLWNDWYLPAAMPALERLFFSHVPPGAKVLDLCCGSGHVTKELVARGYDVTGVDASAALIEHARTALPGARFEVQDVRSLEMDEQFDAVLSTFDSLNHILSITDLREVFRRVKRLLRDTGQFVFDMNLEQAYSADLQEWAVTVGDSNVTLVRGTYDPDVHKGSTELIWFVRDEGTENTWRRRHSIVEERCYPQEEIVMALRDAGFRHIEPISAAEAGMQATLAFGRCFFTAR
jgi:SAM-dependent methyltransferase